MAGMVLPVNKHLIFLADPIEDNPNHDWADYKYNYESTVLASLLFPEVSTFEVMPGQIESSKGNIQNQKKKKKQRLILFLNMVQNY